MRRELLGRAMLAAVSRSRFLEYHTVFNIRGERQRFNIPIVQGVGKTHFQEHEPEVLDTLKVLLGKRSGAFIDIGANIGQTLLKLRSLDLERPYIGFDVSSFCCYYIEKLIEANGFRNSAILPVGTAAELKVADLLHDTPFDASATVVANFRGDSSYEHTKKVVVVNGDVVLKSLNLESIAAVKIDVEGGEADVLAGLTETVAAFRPFILVEILPFSHIEKDDSVAGRSEIVRVRKEAHRSLHRFLEHHAYQPFRMHRKGRFEAVDSFDQETFRMEACNYLLAPAEAGIGD